MHTQRIWDLPLRLFHWSLALTVVALVATAKVGDDAMEWHMRLGYLAMSLWLWRVVWGVIGGTWSRFRSWPFLALFRREKTTADPYELWPGHAPSGAWASAGLLIIVGLQVLTGLLADDEIANAGPWSALVLSSTSSLATDYHHGLGEFLLLGMVTLHLCAIVFYTFVKRRSLVPPMLHGNKNLETLVDDSHDGPKLRILAAAALLATSVTVWVLVT